MKKILIYWLFQVFGWSTYGFLQFLILVYDNQPVDKMWVFGEGLQMGGNILLTHSFRFIIIRFKWPNFKLAKLIPLVLTGILLLSVAASTLWLLILGLQSGLVFSDLPGDMVAQAMVVSVVESFFVFSFWSFCYFIYLYVERYNKSLKYEATSREIELKNLKSQLNPHFIFNALNSIRALVDENPEKSKESITQLSHILRNSLNSDRKKLVPFSEELRTVWDYLGLESIRYEERLKTSLEIDEGSEAFEVPPLMLQTLVENGVKHGIAKLSRGGEISIRTRVQPKGLLIQIRNSGQLDDSANISTGLGLKNTKKRLVMIYGDRAELIIRNENDQTVLTEMTIPK